MVTIFISPAKSLDYVTPVSVNFESTVPLFLNDATVLIDILKSYTIAELSELMTLSDSLSQLNHNRYIEWTPSKIVGPSSRQAIFAFDGDVYRSLSAHTLSIEDVNYSQSCLRILSGLYGLLKPLDLIQPHRLEMGTALSNPRGDNLVAFWRECVSKSIIDELYSHDEPILINLASKEYANVIGKMPSDIKVFTPVFKQSKDGVFKTIAVHAKRARGLMARWCIQNKVTDRSQLTMFDMDGYYYDDKRSTKTTLVFIRK